MTSIYCEICSLPHQPTAQLCEQCGHVLGQQPNLDALRQELGFLRRRIVIGSVVTLAMLVANWVLFAPSGVVVLALAPLGWVVFSGLQWRHKAAFLQKAEAKTRT